jgi:hypothetical protein
VQLETSVIYPFFCFFGNSSSKEETAELDPILEEDTKKVGVGVCSYYKSWIWQIPRMLLKLKMRKFDIGDL